MIIKKRKKKWFRISNWEAVFKKVCGRNQPGWSSRPRSLLMYSGRR